MNRNCSLNLNRVYHASVMNEHSELWAAEIRFTWTGRAAYKGINPIPSIIPWQPLNASGRERRGSRLLVAAGRKWRGLVPPVQV